ncbi:peptidoglycan recognition protein family protein [Streptomyces sp. CA-294286]|uniref:peptidoglycan recognition protein family protein n=1 Tax=Streptomyces sp. CA-294286 TaxID=3240070 RepID=UPI003D8CFC59
MRALVASSLGVTCAVLVFLPFALPDDDRAGRYADKAGDARTADLPGATRSLPLAPLGGHSTNRAARPAPTADLPARDVEPFSLVGAVWDDPRAVLEGRVQVRTRTIGGQWSHWQDLTTGHADHGADPSAQEARTGRAHGSTAPLWVGASDGVEVRVRTNGAPLPRGLRLDLVDPGAEPPRPRAVDVDEEVPALDLARTRAEAEAQTGRAGPHIGPRPKIITRKKWGADERLREKGHAYSKTIKAAFVHHSATGNGYNCSQSASVLRSIYRYHVKSSGWRDFGYNFAVDKCGNIYEGRAGGVAKPVLGAHTLGFNTNSMGIAVLGTYSRTTPPAAAVDAVARLTAWKLGLHGANPKGVVHLTSGGSNLYKKGRNVRLNVISGHRDGFATECPGGRLYEKLGTARAKAAELQGR